MKTILLAALKLAKPLFPLLIIVCLTGLVSTKSFAQCTPVGDPSVFGDNVWNVYAWNAGGAIDTGRSWNTNYAGYYTQSSLTLLTTYNWDGFSSPSYSPSYQGCPVQVDNFSWSAKRKGFPCGTYQITYSSTEQAQLFIDSVKVWDSFGGYPDFWQGTLGPESKVEFRATAGVGFSFGQIRFNTLPERFVSGRSCGVNTVMLTSSIDTGNQWFLDSNAIDAATSQSYTATVSGNYSLQTPSAAGCPLLSPPFPVTVYSLPDYTAYGNNVWNVYAFNADFPEYGDPWNVNYAGYYIDSAFNFDTRNQWAPNLSPSAAAGYQGCDVEERYAWNAMRKGFPCGYYQINIPVHEGLSQLYIDSVKVFEHNGILGCCDSHTNVWTGWLTDSSEIMFRSTKDFFGSWGALSFTEVTFYLDADHDGYGNSEPLFLPCGTDTSEYSKLSGDCNDHDASIYPGAPDILFDGIDNNCNGTVDEPCYAQHSVLERTFSTTGYYAPNPRYRVGRSVYLLPWIGLANAGVLEGDLLHAIGWTNFSAPNIAVKGSLKIWLQNTTDDEYTKPDGINNFDTSVATMILVYNDSATIPAISGNWTIEFPAGFTYTGGGLYVATEWTNCGTLSGIVSQDISPLGGGLRQSISAFNSCTPNGTLGNLTNIAPVTQFYLQTHWYVDADHDGYYTGDPILTCVPPGPEYVDVYSVIGGGDCNDSDANIHEPVQYYVDADHDGYGSTTTEMLCSSTAPVGYSAYNTDCNDNDATVHSPIQYYVDADHDGYGSTTTEMLCSSTAPVGYSTNNTDCDDNDPTVHEPIQYYVDADHDGYGSTTTEMICSSTPPVGYSINSTDCNDANAAINPNTVWYLDADNDGYYNGSGIKSCSSPGTGYKYTGLTGGGDCNDANALINPATVWYKDADNDGYYKGTGTISCTSPGPTYKYTGLSGGGDCNDNDNTIHPNATELCDGKDNNCNGQIDEGCSLPSVSIANASKAEGNKGQSNMVFTVSLNKTSTKKVTVSYATQNGTAIAGSDYAAKSGTVSIAAGSLTATISISVNGDKTIEPNETFTVTLSNPVNASLGSSVATGTILNDDGSVAAASAITFDEDKRVLTVMPNPVSNILKVNLEGYSGDVTIQLSNSEGKLLKQEKLIALDKFTQKQMDISRYANGIYFISAIDEKGNRQTEKFVVAH